MMPIKIFFFLLNALAAKECIPEYEHVDIPHKGKYHRIHPSGDYVLFTNPIETIQEGEPDVYLVDMSKERSKKDIKIIPTVLRTESYPVEPTWDYISSPDSSYQNLDVKNLPGLSFFRFDEIKSRDKSNFHLAKADFSDESNFGYYHSVAEFKDAKGKRIIRATRWMSTEMIDYEIKKDSKGGLQLTRKNTSHYCRNLTQPHEKQTEKAHKKWSEAQTRYIEAEEALLAMKEEASKEEQAKLIDKVEALRIETDKANKEYMYWLNLANLSTPIISKDGKYLATRYDNPDTIKVFRLDDKGHCELVADTGYQGSKVSFSYPEEGRMPKVVFSDYDWLSAPLIPVDSVDNEDGVTYYTEGRRVIVYDLETNLSYQINGKGDTRAEYPGFTKDGRVIYSTGRGLAIVDAVRIVTQNQDCVRLPQSVSPSGSKPSGSSNSGTR